MARTRSRMFLGLLLAAPILLAQSILAQTVPAPTTEQPAKSAVTPRHKSHRKQKELVLPPLPSGPLSQLPMDQIPATPAKVSYQDGLLAISAQNSSLGEILRDVRKVTGATIEIPQGSGTSERVVAHLGPGAPRDVLAGLLNGTSFNYVMLGSSSDPNAVSSVILTSKPSAGGETQVAANVPENNSAPMPPTRFAPPQPLGQPSAFPMVNGRPAPVQADDSKDDDDSADDSADDQAQPAQPEPAGANAQEQPAGDQSQPNAGPKSPEQIMDMLRRQQQPPGGIVTPPQPPQQ